MKPFKQYSILYETDTTVPDKHNKNELIGQTELDQYGDPGEWVAVPTHSEYDYPLLNMSMYKHYLLDSYISKKPLLIYGDPGQGKSVGAYDIAHDIAEAKNRKFIDWAKASDEEKIDTIKNPEIYFIFMDVRAAMMEPTDIQGFMEPFSDVPYVKTKHYQWIYACAQPNADGICFFDEINQAEEQVIKALYKVINKKEFGDVALNDNFAIMAAGNLGEEHPGDNLPPALMDRFKQGVGWLVVNPKEWLDWAKINQIHKLIISFIASKPEENFRFKADHEGQTVPTPRSLEELSHHFYAIDKRWKNKLTGVGSEKDIYANLRTNPFQTKWMEYSYQANMLCGAKWREAFMTWLTYYKNFTWEGILRNVKSFGNQKDVDVGEMYAMLAWIESHASQLIKLDKDLKSAEGKNMMENIITVFNSLHKEYGAHLMALMISQNPESGRTFLQQAFFGDYNNELKKMFNTKFKEAKHLGDTRPE